MGSREICWPHAPVHQLPEGGTFFVTAARYRKAPLFRGRQRLEVLHRGLLKVANDFGWHLEVWAVFANHYHFIAHSPETDGGPAGLPKMIGTLHCKTAQWINRLDNTPNRMVWFNYLDTNLTFRSSYLVRLNYVHHNAVKHGRVPVANQYPWCSAAWFENTASQAMVESIYRFNIDKVAIDDGFAVPGEW